MDHDSRCALGWSSSFQVLLKLEKLELTSHEQIAD